MPFTTVDFPLVSAACVVFCQGCPWRCSYCQNASLQPIRGKTLPWHEILQRIEERRNFLDGVVFSGGEPLLQEALQEALQEIRALGLKTALHTGGALPERFLQVLPWLDWVGFDVKTDFESYNQLTGVAGSSQAAIKSLNQLIQSGVPFECRTTLDPKWVSPLQLLQLVRVLKELGIQNYALQECYDENRQALPTLCWDPKVLGEVRSHIPNVVLRRSGGERGLLPK